MCFSGSCTPPQVSFLDTINFQRWHPTFHHRRAFVAIPACHRSHTIHFVREELQCCRRLPLSNHAGTDQISSYGYGRELSKSCCNGFCVLERACQYPNWSEGTMRIDNVIQPNLSLHSDSGEGRLLTVNLSDANTL